MVSSIVYPSLERKPGGPDNWVEAAGGLPSYIERIAKHLHYEKGMSISRSIAVAVNTVKRWAAGGTVTEHGTTKRVSLKTQALAARAVAEWEAKKRAGAIALSETSAGETAHAILASMDVKTLAERANEIVDPEARHRARVAILDLAVPKGKLTAEKRRGYAAKGQALQDGSFPIFDAISLRSAIKLANTPEHRRHCMRRARALGLSNLIPESWTIELSEDVAAVLIDLSSSIPARKRGNGRAKDGRPSFKRQGKWGHGFVPLDQAAKEAKAKGSPIAMNRMNRLFGGKRSAAKPMEESKQVKIGESSLKAGRRGSSEKVSRVAFARRLEPKSSSSTQRVRLGKSDRAAKGNGSQRAFKQWESIPDAEKTVRNGKKYVLTTYGGRQILTEWVGGVRDQTPGPLNKRKQVRSVTGADLNDMSTAELRQLLKNPKTPKSVRRNIRKMLNIKAKKVASRG